MPRNADLIKKLLIKLMGYKVLGGLKYGNHRFFGFNYPIFVQFAYLFLTSSKECNTFGEIFIRNSYHRQRNAKKKRTQMRLTIP